MPRSALLRLRDALRGLPVLGRPMLALGRVAYIGGRSLITGLTGLLQLPGSALHFRREWHSADNAGISQAAAGRKIVMLVVADLRFDPRVEREARALAGDGFDVHVIWTDPQWVPGGPGAGIDWGSGVTFEALPMSAARFSEQFPGFLGRRMLEAALAHRPFAFHGHDLDTALVALTAARRTGAHAICDFHEWYSENVTWHPLRRTYRAHSWPVKAGYRWLERFCFAHATALITVCDSIADEMASQFGDGQTKVHVIRNIPDRLRQPSRDYLPLKQQFGLADDRFVLLWQGGLGPSRMIEPVIEALAFAPAATLVIRGPEIETYGPGYRAIAERIGASERLILAPAIPSRDVVAAARGADAGVWTLPNLCKNFTYALPNKIFEYLSSGLPVLVADYPEAKRLVEHHGVGLTFDPYDPRSIATAINRLVADPALAARQRASITHALAELDSVREWQKLVMLYRSLVPANT
jgi:glycosyltransferase involved in cell wall biosynthesis